MADFTYRADEWDISGDTLLADIEITLDWSYQDGRPNGFIVYDCRRFDGMGVSSRVGALTTRNSAPIWMQGAMMAWVAENQDMLLALYRERDLDDEQSAEDAAWERQQRSTLPSRATHLAAE